MKKYFVKETDELVELGDVFQVAFEKELEDGKVTVEKEFELEDENDLELLINLGVIEEKEEEESSEEPLVDLADEGFGAFKSDLWGFREAVAEDIEELSNRVDKLEEGLAVVTEALKKIKTAKPVSKK